MPLLPLKTFETDRRGMQIALASSLSDDDASLVADVVTGAHHGERFLSGTRSTIVPSRTGAGGLKIKGAGLRGGPIQFGRYLSSNPLPFYDFEGNASEAKDKNWGRAFLGGLSYQQARQEFVYSSYLLERGARVLVPRGYGCVTWGEHTSWFAVLESEFAQERGWTHEVNDLDDVRAGASELGRTIIEYQSFGLHLILNGMIRRSGAFVRKDFHAAHLAGINDSFMSRLSYLLFDANFILYFLVDRFRDRPPEFLPESWRCFVRALTGEEFELAQVERFKALCAMLKFADNAPLGERLTVVRRDPIARRLLDLVASNEPLLESRALRGAVHDPFGSEWRARRRFGMLRTAVNAARSIVRRR